MNKIYLLLITIFILFFGCTSSPPSMSDQKMKVTVSFFPLEQIVRGVTGEKAEVFSLVPSGVEPHDYEPTPLDLKKLETSDAYFILGLGFSSFEEQTKNILSKKVKVFEVSKGISTINVDGKTDPHIWLSPKRMKQMTQNVYEALIRIDDKNSQQYQKNAAEFEAKLDALDSKFLTGLSKCNKSIILTSHAAFGYLAADYNFTQIGISGLDPETEPNPSQIRELIDLTKKYNLKYIFYEELVDPRISQTIANEAGAKTLELNPLEGSKTGENYFQIQQRNLQNLRFALECN